MKLSYKYLILLIPFLFIQCMEAPMPDVHMVPEPHNYSINKGILKINNKTKIIALSDSLKPLAYFLSEQIHKVSGLSLDVATEGNEKRNIVLGYNKTLKEEAYHLNIEKKKAFIEAANYNSLAMGTATLLQLITVKKGQVILPNISISDEPDYKYRSVMLDLARFWHPTETIKETIDLLWLYKIKYLHLHLSDNRRFTFPLEGFPELQRFDEKGSREYYTIEELKELVAYAKQRGITIIPEIDLPGHSTELWSKYPETFGSIDPKTKKAKALYVVNMAKEETYKACETIIDKLSEVFYTSPYIHFGGDEVYLEAIKTVPEYKTYCKEHNLELALKGDANELFCHFINRMDAMVKAKGKKSLIWEGFHGTGAGKETISKDITVIVWNATYNKPDNLVANGYKIVNAAWIPWYMVGAMNLAPSTENAYNWDAQMWSHWDDKIDDIKIEANQATLGAQICFWEQNHYKVIPVLRERVPVMAERLWNKNRVDDYTSFLNRYEKQNQLYSQLFSPVEIVVDSLIQEEDQTFTEFMDITLKSSLEGQIKYTYSDSWDMPDMDKASVYNEKITLKKSGILTTQHYGKDGNKIGFPIQEYYYKIEPIYQYKVFGPAPNKGWNEMPNFEELQRIREGVSGRMTSERLKKINGELFAKVKKEGHIETRFKGIYNQYAVELKGNISIKETNDYQLRLQTHDGLAELYIDDKLVAKGENFGNKPEEFNLKLTAGTHKITIKYFYKQIQNQLSILYKTPEMKDFEPFEDLALPLK
ncbi:family 20 glycosylhydrolase [Flavivirga eckloniae]|uniref:beta-N-acetylhexosaminidase n=1 Tax=Flavivirga eckloniae TaxID=1803846 RepID=A0A2K9PQ53_9FLAO|nr:family 20 glycosylhydrolase [Flavivirga eckloniae]AUP78697.1 hypothetical protein C1H87_08250 [Flavivirga eckloniae]